MIDTMIKAGDVFSMQTASGSAYFQFVKKNPLMGALIRVLPGMYLNEPDLDELVQKETNFWIFFPVGSALKKKIIQRVKNVVVPLHSKETPVFRTGVVDPSTGRVENWWFWDGEEGRMVGEITEEQRKFPIRGVWNDTLLIQRIEEGWLPEKDKR